MNMILNLKKKKKQNPLNFFKITVLYQKYNEKSQEREH